MRKTILPALLFMLFLTPLLRGQEADSTLFSVYYSSPKKLTIADVEITGIRYLDQDVLLQLSGLKIGQEVSIPGEEVSSAIKKLWQQGLFSDVKITAVKIYFFIDYSLNLFR